MSDNFVPPPAESERAVPERFDPTELDRMVITPPLLYEVQAETDTSKLHAVIIDLNLDYPGGRDGARQRVVDLIRTIAPNVDPASYGIRPGGADPTRPYLFASLPAAVIKAIVRHDRADAIAIAGSADQTPVSSGNMPPTRNAIYRIWEDHEIGALITKSIATVKADAAQIAYSALGTDIVFAVIDSGIESGHVHFAANKNLDLPGPVKHRDFTGAVPEAPLVDAFGHGTHVAGIIAGGFTPADRPTPLKAMSRVRDEDGNVTTMMADIVQIAGMAPRCKVVSLKVLDASGRGRVSFIIDAIQEIQKVNDYGRHLLIHGVNLSVGYDFDPKWFACGQSPLCVEVDRLVRSGVVVVVAAGNTGYGYTNTEQRGQVAAGMALSINDPGNAELAITVGSTHRDMPHTYGVSYFSSKGPTGDGRLKPDLVAPGERIISSAGGRKRINSTPPPAGAAAAPQPSEVDYVEDSGTSMAAPHVAGTIAAFLSIRREFIGQPQAVKQTLLDTATDLKRDRTFQGAGLVDLMRAIQSV